MSAPKIQETAIYPIETLNGRHSDRRRMDVVAIEAPLEVRFAGRPATVLMRTPGHDEELIRGFLYNEGMISQADEILSLSRPDDVSDPLADNVIDVQLSATRRRSVLDRSFISKRELRSLRQAVNRIAGDQSGSRGVEHQSSARSPDLPSTKTEGRSTDVFAHRRRPCVRPLHARRGVGGGP